MLAGNSKDFNIPFFHRYTNFGFCLEINIMKTALRYYLIFVILIIFPGCEDEEREENLSDYRSIAFESLSDNEKETLMEDWREAEVIEGIFKDDECDYEFHGPPMGRLCFFLTVPEIELINQQNLVAVIFHTINDALLGPIIIIIDPESEMAIGTVGRF